MIGLNNIVPMMGRIANAGPSGAAEGMEVKVRPSNISADNKTYGLDIVADSFEVDWGDGAVDSGMEHIYADGNSEYTVQITGTNITRLSQDDATLSNNGRALTSLLRMNLPNLDNTDYMFREARNIYDWSNLALPAGLASIGNRAFAFCSSLALTSLPEGLASIGINAFRGCSNLALASLPEGLTSIGEYAFQGCSWLALASLPEGLTSIEVEAFAGCSRLALTSLPEGVTSIGARAFRYCTGLELASLPEGLASIGNRAFQGCSNLANVVFLGTPNSIDGNAFTTSANLFVPWPEGAVANAPWGTSGTVTYGYVS